MYRLLHCFGYIGHFPVPSLVVHHHILWLLLLLAVIVVCAKLHWHVSPDPGHKGGHSGVDTRITADLWRTKTQSTIWGKKKTCPQSLQHAVFSKSFDTTSAFVILTSLDSTCQTDICLKKEHLQNYTFQKLCLLVVQLILGIGHFTTSFLHDCSSRRIPFPMRRPRTERLRTSWGLQNRPENEINIQSRFTFGHVVFWLRWLFWSSCSLAQLTDSLIFWITWQESYPALPAQTIVLLSNLPS